MRCIALVVLAVVVSLGAAFRLNCGDYGSIDFDDTDLGKARCPQDIKPVYNLFTRANRNRPQSVTRHRVPGVFKSYHPTVFIVHGFTQDHTADWMHSIKNALLDKAYYNVIIVGWGNGAGNPYYPEAAADTYGVGLGVRAIARALISKGSSKGQLYCTGHSLGAHVCGHAGRLLNKFGKVWGLDPAGPLWEGYNRGLRKNAASHVQTIHTDGKGLVHYGTLDPLGHASFYPNGGGNQPGCLTFLNKAMRLKTGHYDIDVACNHGRAPKYFLQSIKQDCFVARHKCDDKNKVNDKCPGCWDTVMGYGGSTWSEGLFYVPVKGTNPFCKW